MNDQRIAVLSVSDDQVLLETRARVLGLLGVDVVSCLSREAMDVLTSHPFELLILGHSLKFIEAEQIAASARSVSPTTRVLLLTQSAFQMEKCAFADAVTEPDPSAVLSRARELLGIGTRA